MGEHRRARKPGSAYAAKLPHELRYGIALGLIMAALYCLVALALFALGGNTAFTKNDTTLFGAIAAYLATGIAGGILLGVLHPLRASLLGQVVLGILIGNIAFFCIELATTGLPTRWSAGNWEAVGFLGTGMGAIAAGLVHWRSWPPA